MPCRRRRGREREREQGLSQKERGRGRVREEEKKKKISRQGGRAGEAGRVRWVYALMNERARERERETWNPCCLDSLPSIPQEDERRQCVRVGKKFDANAGSPDPLSLCK